MAELAAVTDIFRDCHEDEDEPHDHEKEVGVEARLLGCERSAGSKNRVENNQGNCGKRAEPRKKDEELRKNKIKKKLSTGGVQRRYSEPSRKVHLRRQSRTRKRAICG